MSSAHPRLGDLVKVVSGTQPKLIGEEGRVIHYEAVNWQSKVYIEPADGESFWAWTWDVVVIATEEARL